MTDVATVHPDPGRRARLSTRRRRPITYVFRLIVTAYLFFLVAWPLSLVVKNTFS